MLIRLLIHTTHNLLLQSQINFELYSFCDLREDVQLDSQLHIQLNTELKSDLQPLNQRLFETLLNPELDTPHYTVSKAVLKINDWLLVR